MNPSERITDRISGLTDWRGPVLARVRQLILEADPEIVEEWKWNSPTWSRHGLLLTASDFKNHVGVTFHQGDSLADPHGLLNASLDAKTMRSIKLHKGGTYDEAAFKDLVRAAVAHNIAAANL